MVLSDRPGLDWQKRSLLNKKPGLIKEERRGMALPNKSVSATLYGKRYFCPKSPLLNWQMKRFDLTCDGIYVEYLILDFPDIRYQSRKT